MANVNEVMVQGTKVVSGEMVTFDTPREVNIRSCKVYFSPKQEGEGDPSPENIRSIQGCDGVTVTHCGENLLDVVHSYSLNWNTDVGTVYGGCVDLVSGELVVDHHKFTLTSNLTFQYRGKTNNNANWFYMSPSQYDIKPAGNIEVIGNMLLYDPSNGLNTMWINASTQGLMLYMDSSINSLAALKSFLDQNSVEICYKIYPQTINLSPTQLTTLLHTNNIWSNADSVEVEYEFVNTFDAMESRKNITKGTPYLETMKGNVLSFGCDMVSDLKECKVWFKPIQDGDGVSSPDNVKDITGWNEINIWHDPQERGTRFIPVDFQEQTMNGTTIKYLGDGKYFFDGKSGTGGSHFDIDIEPISLGDNVRDTYFKYNSSIINMELWNMAIAIRDKDNHNLVTFSSEYKINYGDSVPLPANYSSYYLKGALAQKIRFVLDSDFGDVVITPEIVSSSQLKTIRYPINWSLDFGTIYGGYIDLLKGELVQEWEAIDLSTVDWSYTSTNNRFYKGGYNNYDLGSVQTVKPTIYCNTYEVVPYELVSESSVKDYVFSSNDQYLTIRDTRYTNPTEFKTYLSSIGAIVCAKLKTPIIHSISIQSISTFRGTNKIWTDSNDDIEISYYKHGDDAYQHVPVEAISSNDNFILVTDDGYVIGDEHDYIVY